VTTEPALATPAHLEASYPAVAASVPEARRSVSRWLCAAQADPLMIGDVELVVSEACTNAVVHGYRDTIHGVFRVHAQRNDGSVCVTVSDDGSGMTPRADSPGLGLGLPLMAALTDRLEVAPASDGSGTVVRMHFSAAGAARRLP
jgi:anti-sigma regulatory factor (Ser/Thr protein kinase)